MASADTPLMRQYLSLKGRHPDAILLFRLGDFYEMFFEDAKTASKVLEITLTTRDKSDPDPVPLCGVPHHSVTGYISRLLDRGFKVAVCEQTEDPKLAKGLVNREVVRVISPGCRTDSEGLAADEVSLIVSVHESGGRFGLAWLDVSSGSLRVARLESLAEVEDEVWRLCPREIVVAEGKRDAAVEAWLVALSALRPGLRIERAPKWVFASAVGRLCERFGVAALAGFGMEDEEALAPPAYALIHYVEEVNRFPLAHLAVPSPVTHARFLQLDAATRENLELTRARGESGLDRSLLGVLNETKTAMGLRTLREWVHFPLRDAAAINARLDAVEALVSDGERREGIRRELSRLGDLERLVGRIASGRAGGRDLAVLREALLRAAELKRSLGPFSGGRLAELAAAIDPHEDLTDLLSRALSDSPPTAPGAPGTIRQGYDASVDEARAVVSTGKEWLARLEASERERTNIPSLKVRFNRVFGYTIEVTKAHLSRVPADYVRKQTLAGAERFVTAALKEREETILSAEEAIASLEAGIFASLCSEVGKRVRSMQAAASALCELDVLACFAHTAVSRRYCRPGIVAGDTIRIRAGRHPVVERVLTDAPFVPNDFCMDCEGQRFVILTGPNMAGKSTIMRQVGLICLMAHMGSFVPADEADIGLLDRIFTRVGASDDLARGRSTFMVEMSETANILRNATDKSLVLLDEIGRGTSTFDGLSIAWAVAEDLHDRVRAKTVFATHYHELTDLARTKESVVNLNVSVKEWGDRIVFLRTLADGAVNRSYGIEVARMAGVPASVIARAREVLANLERGELDAAGKPVLACRNAALEGPISQLELFDRRADGPNSEQADRPAEI